MKFLYRSGLAAAFAALFVAPVAFPLSPCSVAYAAKAAESASPFTRDAITAVMRRACDYQLNLQTTAQKAAVRPSGATPRVNNGWIRATFYMGVMAANRTTNDEKYHDAALKWADAAKWKTAAKDPNHADNQACIQVYAELAEKDKTPEKLAPAREAIDAQIAMQPEGRKQWWWCDALYMAPPALARLSAVTGDPKYNTFLDRQYWDSKAFLYDPDEHLFFRDSHYFKKLTKNGKKTFWSRGNGWVVAGLARTLTYLPTTDPHYADFVTLYKDMCGRLAGLQGEDGLWRSSLLDAEEYPMPEASGSVFYVYAMAWGINHGLLDRATYLPIVQKGWTGLVGLVNDEGRLGHVQRVAGSPGPNKAEDTQEYAVGGFLLAGEQLALLADSPKP